MKKTPDMGKVIKGIEHCLKYGCKGCPYNYACSEDDFTLTSNTMIKDALELLKGEDNDGQGENNPAS